MKTFIWVGTVSSVSKKYFDLLNSQDFQIKLKFSFSQIQTLDSDELMRISQTPIILSESISDLIMANEKFNHCIQVLICRSFELTKLFHENLRPLFRYFFLYDLQNQIEFQKLMENLSFSKINSDLIDFSKRKNNINFSTLPSMRNSLAVLNSISSKQIEELEQFIREDEERKLRFRSLIKLIRNLTMSRDIEEIAQAFWEDTKNNSFIKSIFFLSQNNSGTLNHIHYRSGKYFHTPLRHLTLNQKDFFRTLFFHSNVKELTLLTPPQLESLSFILKKSLNPLFSIKIFDPSFETQLYLFFETNNEKSMTVSFKEQLFEQLSFIKLSIEKQFLQENIKSKATLWSTTFDDLSDPLAIFDSDYNLVRYNLKFNQIFIQQKDTQAFSNENITPLEILKSKLILNELEDSFDLPIQNKIYRAHIYVIKDLSPSRSSYIVHTVNISIERALYSRITQTEKMVAISQLAGNLSEALTQPLNHISHLSDKYSSHLSASEIMRHDLVEIHKASERSLKIIDDFEKFSRGTIVKSPIYAETAIEKTIPLIKAIIHGHRFHLHLSEPRHKILASLSLLQQVLYNLLRNAQQSMSSPGLIQISTEAHEMIFNSMKSQPGVKIKILDSGTGVPESMRPMLFQPFISNKGTNGTGLGLNIVKQIVESHGGSVGYESHNSGGSIFWVWLPTY